MVEEDSVTTKAVLAVAHACGALRKQCLDVSELSPMATKALALVEGGLPMLASQENPDGVRGMEALLRSLTRLTESEGVFFPDSEPESRLNSDWMKICADHSYNFSSESNVITQLNQHLTFRTFAAGKSSISAADVLIFASLRDWMDKSTSEQLQALIPLVRWFIYMQQLDGITDMFSPIDVQSRFEQKKTPAPASDLKNKTTDAPFKESKASNGVERPLDDVSRLNIIVGQILDCWPHPDADALYCEIIDVGEAEPRKIASGLRMFIPLEEMKGAKVCVLANMRSKPLRGFNSHGMILCASNPDRTAVELMSPPEDTPIGETIKFEGYPHGPADEVLSTKKGQEPLPAIFPNLICKERVGFYKVGRGELRHELVLFAVIQNGVQQGSR